LSALVEARKNLLLYYEDQSRKQWGYIVHQISNDLDIPALLISEALEELEGRPESNESHLEMLRFSQRRLTSMKNIARLVADAVKSGAHGDAPSLSTADIEDVERNILVQLSELACDLAQKERIRKDYNDDFVVRLERVTTQSLGGLGSILRDVEELPAGGKLSWIDRFSSIVCHELMTNLVRHAPVLENSIEGKWSLGVHEGYMFLLMENQIRPGEKSLSDAKELADDPAANRFSTGLGQLRVGISLLEDPPNIQIKVKEEHGFFFFQIAVPIGHIGYKRTTNAGQ